MCEPIWWLRLPLGKQSWDFAPGEREHLHVLHARSPCALLSARRVSAHPAPGLPTAARDTGWALSRTPLGQRFLSLVVSAIGREGSFLPSAGIQLQVCRVVLHKADGHHPCLAQFSHLAYPQHLAGAYLIEGVEGCRSQFCRDTHFLSSVSEIPLFCWHLFTCAGNSEQAG